MAQTILSLRQIVVRYGGCVALEVDSLDIKNGELLALIGPNGAGKSTLLRVMGLLQSPDAGSVRFGGGAADVQSALALRRRIATVFQEPLLLNESVYNNAALGLRLRGVKRGAIERRLRPCLGPGVGAITPGRSQTGRAASSFNKLRMRLQRSPHGERVEP